WHPRLSRWGFIADRVGPRPPPVHVRFPPKSGHLLVSSPPPAFCECRHRRLTDRGHRLPLPFRGEKTRRVERGHHRPSTGLPFSKFLGFKIRPARLAPDICFPRLHAFHLK